MISRLTKVEYRQMMTWTTSLRGSCNRLHTATTLWTAEPENRLLATGYNGAPSGLSSCDEVGHLIVEGHCVRTNHGEENALLQCRDFDNLRNGIATILGTPCYSCVRKLISKQVKRLEYIGTYNNAQGSEHLKALFDESKSDVVCISVDELIATISKAIAFSKNPPGGMLKDFPNLSVIGTVKAS
ncbi:MAG: hypothetical protein AAB795_02350 [Patescibacteria group bacterium]